MQDLLGRAQRVMPGGVSSPVRAFGAVPGDPPIVRAAKGPLIWDVGGREYIDMVGSWGPLILGHADANVVAAVQAAAELGLTYGATCEPEIRLAEGLLERYGFAERVRFVSSGTEAVMSAVRLARGVTGRSRIVKFDGCYHGHSDGLLVKAGSGLATFGQPTSAGVPYDVAALTDVLPLDDEEAAEKLFAERGERIAAVLIEPMPANAGLLVQRKAFLERLRALTEEHGALLIYDEVISGLRVAPGGMCELTGIVPDLVTLGKIIGGGMPVGAYLGPAIHMDQVAPLGPVYQAGTLSGNPLAMSAGLATLQALEQPGVYGELERLGARFEAGLKDVLAASGQPGCVQRVGSVLWLCLQAGELPRSLGAIEERAAKRYGRLHQRMLEEGIWLAPSAYEVMFVSTAHRDEHLDQVIAAFGRVLAEGPVSA